MLQCKNVSRLFGNFAAVSHVNFDIGSGEVVGLLGHNGAGKTTLMRMITGALEPSEGEILICGHNVEQEPDQTHPVVGYLPEQLPLYPEMTTVQYLQYCAATRGISRSAQPQEVRRVIELTYLGDKALQRIETLSRGYRQRVGVAQALLNNPKLLILDEPTNGLDPDQTAQMRELISSLRQHATVILSTHIMQEVNAVCDRVLMIRHGELALDEKLENLSSNRTIRLETPATAEAVDKAIRPLGFFDNIEISSQNQTLLLHLSNDKENHEACSQLAKALVANDIDIYCLQPEKRDLESLFHQVNEGQEVSNAA